MKKILITLLTTIMMLMGISFVASAAGTCTCDRSTWPHDTSHAEFKYVVDGLEGSVKDAQHYVLCYNCMRNGHLATCEQVRLRLENHSYQYQGNGADRKKVCAKCNYSIPAPCYHTNTKWEWASTENCSLKCQDCGYAVKTENHTFQPDNTGHEDRHGMLCSKCRKYDTFDKPHNFTNTYKAYKVPKTPIVDIAEKTSAPLYHSITSTCKDCGYTYTANTFSNPNRKHVFSGNKCKYCGYKRTILPKVKGLKVNQKGKLSSKTWTVAAHWEWVGNKLYWRKASKVTGYFFKVGLKWNKVKNAYGYVISTSKPKQGGYVNKVGKGYSHTYTKKNSYSYFATFTNKKTKSLTIYVAPLSKDGYIGKAQAIKVKVQ